MNRRDRTHDDARRRTLRRDGARNGFAPACNPADSPARNSADGSACNLARHSANGSARNRSAGKNGRMMAAVAAMMIGWTIGLTGCRSAEEMAMVDVPVRGWHHGVEVRVEPPDTESLYDLDLLVRYNHNFTVDTLTLWFRTQSPDTLIYTERCRFELPMSDRPAAIRPVVKLPWRCGVRFSGAEPYKIRITPLQPVHGIEAVGLLLRPVAGLKQEPEDQKQEEPKEPTDQEDPKE